MVEGYIIECVNIQRTQIDWEKGELPNTAELQVFTHWCFGSKVFKTIKDLIEYVEMDCTLANDMGWFTMDDGRLTCQYSTNDRGDYPTQEEWDKFQKGEMLLWVHCVDIYIAKVVKTTPTMDDIEKEGIKIF
jgi:hypothetical protein